jgi:FixJ family two-component response regulator
MGQAVSLSARSANGASHALSSSFKGCVTRIVFVVDDDVLVRQSLESLIDSAGWQPKTFASATEFLAYPRPTFPSCLVLDVVLPDLNGLDLQERISAERIQLPIIFITGYGDVPMTVRAMKRGAIEFLTKPFRADVLLSAIAHGLERSCLALTEETEMHALRERHAALSRREREVMALVVAGLRNKEVSLELGISEITVKAHRSSMMRKMTARSLPQLVNMAARLGLAPECFRASSEGNSFSASAWPQLQRGSLPQS